MLVPDPEPDAPGRLRVKILDFGVAKIATTTGRQASQTRSAVVMGTPTYMSPEQCKDASRVDPKTDVYSLGVIMYELLVGRPPFYSESDTELMAKHMYEQPPPLRTLALDIPDEVTQLTERMLTKVAAQRPSMAQVLERLEALVRRGDEMSMSGRLHLAAAAASAEISSTLPPIGESRQGRIIVGGVSVGTPSSISTRASSRTPAMSLSEAEAALSSQSLRKMAVAMPGRRPTTVIQSSQRALLALVGVTGLAFGFYFARGVRESGKTGGPAVEAPVQPASGPLRPEPAEPRAGATVRWSVTTEPPGATIVRVDNGQSIGVTPWQSERQAQAGALAVRLRLGGYEERLLALDQGTDASINERLRPRPQPTPVEPDPVEPPPADTARRGPSTSERSGERSGERKSGERRRSRRGAHEPVLED